MLTVQRIITGIILVILFTVVQSSFAQNQNDKFTSPYNDGELISSFFTRSDGTKAYPCENLPDGQIHWCEGRLPGIDLKKVMPDGQGAGLYNPCPEGGYAWSDPGGDPYSLGSGSNQFVAIECEGSRKGWQSIFFHVAQALVPQNGQENPVFVGPREIVAIEGNHTHWSLGYWGKWQLVGCDQYASQGRWFVNPVTCDIVDVAVNITEQKPAEETGIPVSPKVIVLPAIALVISVLVAVVRLYWAGVQHEVFRPSPKVQFAATVATCIIVSTGFLFIVAVVSWVPVTRKSGVISAPVSPTFATNENVKRLAETAGYKDPALLQAFIDRCIPRRQDGSPSSDGEFGKVFPCWTAAAIPLGETNSESWVNPDPRLPGPWGHYLGWYSATERWPASWWQKINGQISDEAQACRDGLTAIASDLTVQSIWPGIKPWEMYSSSACAVGRGQTLALYFRAGGPLDFLWSKDVWSDPHVSAEVVYWHLTSRGCNGSWWETSDVSSALCGYNPNAWNDSSASWYWQTLRDGSDRLETSYLALGVEATMLQQGEELTILAPNTVGTYTVWETVPSLGYRWSRDAENSWRNNQKWYGQTAYNVSRNLVKFFYWWGTSVYSPQSEAELGFQKEESNGQDR